MALGPPRPIGLPVFPISKLGRPDELTACHLGANVQREGNHD